MAHLPFKRVELALCRIHFKVGHDIAKTKATVSGPFRVEAHVELRSGFHRGAQHGWGRDTIFFLLVAPFHFLSRFRPAGSPHVSRRTMGVKQWQSQIVEKAMLELVF